MASGVSPGAALVFLISLLLSIIKRDNKALARQTQIAMLIAILPVLLLGSQVKTARSVPSIHNISTDVENPPQFDKVVSLRGEGSNPHEYDKQALAQIQQAAYPNIKTLELNSTKEQVFAKSKNIAIEMGWDLVSVDEQAGLIEATATTAMWGFKDDVVIRIQAESNQVLLDMRSVSRIGQSV